MSRRYTAKDMRETADDFENYSDMDESVIADMLRQAAEDLEREESREKKYEYAIVANGVTYNNHYCDFRSATLNRGFGEKVVRRAIGEWEEVQDAQ